MGKRPQKPFCLPGVPTRRCLAPASGAAEHGHKLSQLASLESTGDTRRACCRRLTYSLGLRLHCKTQGLPLAPLSCLAKLLARKALKKQSSWMPEVQSFLNPADLSAAGENTFPKTHAVPRHLTSDGFTSWELIFVLYT